MSYRHYEKKFKAGTWYTSYMWSMINSSILRVHKDKNCFILVGNIYSSLVMVVGLCSHLFFFHFYFCLMPCNCNDSTRDYGEIHNDGSEEYCPNDFPQNTAASKDVKEDVEIK